MHTESGGRWQESMLECRIFLHTSESSQFLIGLFYTSEGRQANEQTGSSQKALLTVSIVRCASSKKKKTNKHFGFVWIWMATNLSFRFVSQLFQSNPKKEKNSSSVQKQQIKIQNDAHPFSHFSLHRPGLPAHDQCA